jgi:hypothetical protein
MVLKSEFDLLALTERRFRLFWDRTKGDERVRFRDVANLMKEEVSFRRVNRPKIGKDLVARYADGKWHNSAAMTRAIGADEDHVIDTLGTMTRLRGTYGAGAERKAVGTSAILALNSGSRRSR